MRNTADVGIIATSRTCDQRIDINPPRLPSIFEMDTSAAGLMGYLDEHMRGRMFASVLELFLSDDLERTASSLGNSTIMSVLPRPRVRMKVIQIYRCC